MLSYINTCPALGPTRFYAMICHTTFYSIMCCAKLRSALVWHCAWHLGPWHLGFWLVPLKDLATMIYIRHQPMLDTWTKTIQCYDMPYYTLHYSVLCQAGAVLYHDWHLGPHVWAPGSCHLCIWRLAMQSYINLCLACMWNHSICDTSTVGYLTCGYVDVLLYPLLDHALQCSTLWSAIILDALLCYVIVVLSVLWYTWPHWPVTCQAVHTISCCWLCYSISYTAMIYTSPCCALLLYTIPGGKLGLLVLGHLTSSTPALSYYPRYNMIP